MTTPNFSLLLCMVLAACGGSDNPSPTDGGTDAVGIDSAVDPACAARALADRPDEQSGYQIHPLYVVPADGEDRALDQSAALTGSMASFRRWFTQQTGGASLRIDTCKGRPDFSFLRLSATEAQVRALGVRARDEIERSVRAAGFISETKIYLAFYEGKTLDASCAAAPWPPTRTSNVAAVYLRGEFSNANIPPCAQNPMATEAAAPGYFEFATLHELVHAMGFAPACAPHSVGSGHVGDSPQDLMYAGNQPWRPAALDVGSDDYFKAGISGCYDLTRSSFLDPLPAQASPPPSW